MRNKIFTFLFLMILLLNTSLAYSQLQLVPSNSRLHQIGFEDGETPSFIIYNRSTLAINGKLHLELLNESGLIKALFTTGYEVLETGPNRSEDFIWNREIQTSSLLPSGNYFVKVKVTNAEDDRIIFESNFTIEILPRQLIVASPQGDLFPDQVIEFCSFPKSSKELTGGVYSVAIWDNADWNAGLVQSQEMPPLHSFQDADNCLMYPIHFPKLQLGNLYRFQVSYFVQGELIAISPMSEFKVAENVTEKPGDYRLISSKVNTGKYLFGHQLRFGFYNRYDEKYLNYELIDLNRKKNLRDVERINLKSGLNTIDIDIEGIQGITYGHSYKMVIKDKNKDQYSIVFDFNRLLND